MSESIEQRAVRVIAEFAEKNVKEVRADATFEELGIDSLGAAALIYDLEEEFEVTIPNEQALRIRTVQEAIRSLEKGLGGAAEGS